MNFGRDDRKMKSLKYASIIILILYLIYLIYLTFFDLFFGREVFHRIVNLIPFRTILSIIMYTKDIRIILINIAGNIAAFMPLGFLLPVISQKLNHRTKILCIAFFVSLTIEGLQFIFGVGVTDIDDIILNVLGGGLGFLLNKRLISLAQNKM